MTPKMKKFFEKYGYCVIKNCISQQDIHRFLDSLESKSTDGASVVSEEGAITKGEIQEGQKHYRILDLHKIDGAARVMAFNESIIERISFLFGKDCNPTQSLTFVWPSEQRIHQDWPYVTTVKNNEYMIGAWIACEKVTLDNGPLFYYPQSHKIERFKFANNWEENSDKWIEKFETHLNHEMKLLHIKPRLFTAEPGDVLIWHGDLAHGGSEAKKPDLTRRSVIIHYEIKND